MISKIIEEDISEIVSEFENELTRFEGKTILITGGSGLIPSYIIDTIAKFNKRLNKPCKMIIMNKNPVNESSRLSHLINNENTIFLTQDVGKKFDIPWKVNIIIHAASRANPSAFLQDPIDTIDANVNGTRNLLEYARENPVEQFIFFSSAEIYGNPVKEFIPCPETYTGNADCINTWACYIESKKFSETLCMTYFRKYNVPVKILRILLIYGPGMRNDGKVVSDFLDRAIKTGEITIRDKGEALRSFCYISDTAKAIFKIIFNGNNGEVYNIGNDIETENVSILQLANLIAKTVGEDIKVKPNPDAVKKQIYGVDNRRVNISKLRSLGFEPKVSLEEGLERLKKHYDEVGGWY